MKSFLILTLFVPCLSFGEANTNLQTLNCTGKTLTGETIELNICTAVDKSRPNKDVFTKCPITKNPDQTQSGGSIVKIKINGEETSNGYYAQKFFVGKIGNSVDFASVNSVNDGLETNFELSFTTEEFRKGWNTLKATATGGAAVMSVDFGCQIL